MLAERGAVEALALRGLSSDQIRVIERLVAEGGGEVLSNTDGDRAVLLMPLMTAGTLPDAAGGLERQRRRGGRGDRSRADGARCTPRPRSSSRATVSSSADGRLVMGILNVTPDSFSGDGVSDDVAAAVARAELLASEGADIVDIGGESTRPSRTREEVSAEVELARVLPVIRELAGRLTVPISIDTRKSAVAAAALGAGAVIVNDVWGLRGDPRHGRGDRRSPRNGGRRHAQPASEPTTATSWRTSASDCARVWRSPRRQASGALK